MRYTKPRLVPDVVVVASLLSDPSRALILQALADARARPAGELAKFASVTAQTASAHLGRLLEAGLIAVARQGRHRYFRLRDSRVAQLLESLGAFARPTRQLEESRGDSSRNLRFARLCYRHLAGTVGVALAEALCQRGLMRRFDERFDIAPDGHRWFRDFGVDTTRLGPRPLVRGCLDWSERGYHLAGALGVALTSRLLELRWLVPRREPRALRLTGTGEDELRRVLGIELAATRRIESGCPSRASPVSSWS